MNGFLPGQQNPYKGSPERAWIRVRILSADGTFDDLDLIADTGSPYALVVPEGCLNQRSSNPAADEGSTLGLLRGGELHVAIPEVGLDTTMVSYGCDAVVVGARLSHLDFAGLAGLPLLRLMDYGGDANGFWIRPAGTTP